MSHFPSGPADELDYDFDEIAGTRGDDPTDRVLLEQLALDTIRDDYRRGRSGRAGNPAGDPCQQSELHLAATVDEQLLSAVTEEVLAVLRSSSEGQLGQDEMLAMLTAMHGELSGE